MGWKDTRCLHPFDAWRATWCPPVPATVQEAWISLTKATTCACSRRSSTAEDLQKKLKALLADPHIDVFDGETFATFLIKLRSRAIRSQRKTVVILDNARFHHAKLHKEWRELCQEYFALVFLPPYSPELNTIERTWKLTRRPCTHNRYFATLNEVITAVETQFQQWSSPNESLRQLCSFT